MEILESANEVESNFPSASHNLIDLDNYCSDSSTEDDEWIGFDEIMDVDAYSALQAHFDHMDIPPDIEAPIPWLSHGQNGNKTNIETSSLLAEPQIKPVSVNQLGKSPAHIELKAALANSLNLPAEIDVHHPPEGIKPFASFPSRDVQPNKKSAASRYGDKSVSPYEVNQLNSLLGIDAAKPRWFMDAFKRKKKLHGSNNFFINQSDAMKLHNGGETSDTSDSLNKQVGLHNISHSNLPPYMDFFNYPEAGGPSMPPHWQKYAKMKAKETFFPPHVAGLYGPFNPLGPPTLGEVVNMPLVQGSTKNLPELAPDDSVSETISPGNLDELLGNYESFKQFDTVDDHSDHHYTSKGFSLKQV